MKPNIPNIGNIKSFIILFFFVTSTRQFENLKKGRMFNRH
jgi:hypothetical protein